MAVLAKYRQNLGSAVKNWIKVPSFSPFSVMKNNNNKQRIKKKHLKPEINEGM